MKDKRYKEFTVPILLEYLKPKPKWMPWWLYKFCQETAIHMDKIDPIAKLKNK